jgi:hypothetical protein
MNNYLKVPPTSSLVIPKSKIYIDYYFLRPYYRYISCIPFIYGCTNNLAINKKGDHGAYAVHAGFDYALYQNGVNKMIDAVSFVK